MRYTIHRDESFNSITGLNGSGKSNILDSICFVLGITNMSTVRAQNLQVPHQLSNMKYYDDARVEAMGNRCHLEVDTA